MSQFLKAKIIDPVTGLPNIVTFADQTYIDQQIQLGFANKVTSITGAVNQIIVTGTTTPVLSLSNTLILPGTLITTGDLTVNSTGYLKMAVGTTLERPTLPAVGMTRFNTTLGLFEIYNGTSWIGLSGGSGTVSSVGLSVGSGLSLTGSPITSSGTMSLSLNTQLQTLSAMSNTGFVVVTNNTTKAIANRALTTGTGLSITNGDGVSGNPVISLNDTAVTSGTYAYPSSLTINAQGQLTSITAGSSPITSLTLTGAITGSGSSSIATTLNNNQTMVGSTLSFNWSNNGSFAEYSNYHTLQDSNPPSHFVHVVQSGSGSKYRRWLTVYKPGFGSSPSGTYEINFYHAVNGFQYPFKIDTYGSTLRTYFGTIVDMQNNEIINAAFPTTSSSLATKGYADSLITAQLQNLNNLNTLGFVVLSSTGSSSSSFATRTLTAGTGITITNGDGIAGNPTISWDSSTIYINSLPINGQLNLSTYGIITSGNINVQTGTLRGNNLAAYNSGSINCLNSISMNNKNIERIAYLKADNIQADNIQANNIQATSGDSIWCVNPLANLTLGNNFNLNGYKLNDGWSSMGFVNGTLEVISEVILSRNYSYGWLNSGGGTGKTSGSNFYNIVCSNRIAASEFNATSSKKIKKIECNTNYIIQDLKDQFLKLNFYKYSYIDEQDGKGDHYGIIAEDLADIFPQFVDLERKRYVPNYVDDNRKMTEAVFEYIKDNICVFSHKIDLKIIDKESRLIKLFINDRFYEVKIKEINSYELKVIFNKKDLSSVSDYLVKGFIIYIYGTYEKCPTVEKNKLAEIGLILLQDLIKKVDQLQHNICGKK